jgi:hypothetical protein
LLGLAATRDAHRGVADVIAALREGHGGTIGGTWGSASALPVAAVAKARASEAGTLVVVLPHAAEADDFVDDVALFSDLPALLLPAVESFGEDDGPTGDPAESRAGGSRHVGIRGHTGGREQRPLDLGKGRSS